MTELAFVESVLGECAGIIRTHLRTLEHYGYDNEAAPASLELAIDQLLDIGRAARLLSC